MRVCYAPGMTERDADSGFQIRDRRRRDDEPSPAEADRRERPPESGPGVRPPDGQARERTLIGLFMMLASFAVAALDGVPDPGTGQVDRDPQQAAELIDILMLLREKTEGHRTAEETQMLEGIIYDLQLRYVKATSPS